MQVFVANPNKPQPIVDILANNRDKLLKYLEEFHTEKGILSRMSVLSSIMSSSLLGHEHVCGIHSLILSSKLPPSQMKMSSLERRRPSSFERSLCSESSKVPRLQTNNILKQ